MQRDGVTAIRTDNHSASTGAKSEGTNWVLQRQLNEARRANGELDFDAFLRIISRHYDRLD